MLGKDKVSSLDQISLELGPNKSVTKANEPNLA